MWDEYCPIFKILILESSEKYVTKKNDSVKGLKNTKNLKNIVFFQQKVNFFVILDPLNAPYIFQNIFFTLLPFFEDLDINFYKSGGKVIPVNFLKFWF